MTKTRPEPTALLRALAELVPAAEAPPRTGRERLLAAALAPALRYAPLFGRLHDLFDLADPELSAIFERAERPQEWAQAPIPGTALFHLVGGPRVAAFDNGLVRVTAGTRFPQHRHLGSERVVVLEGGYCDEPSGRVYRAGDLHEMGALTVHSYTALPERDLLLAVSVERGVEVDGFGTLSPSSK